MHLHNMYVVYWMGGREGGQGYKKVGVTLLAH